MVLYYLGAFAAFFQHLSSGLEACPAANLVVGYKVRDGSKIMCGCQNSWLCSMNVCFPFCFVGFVLNACLYLHFSKERELLSHLYLLFSLFTSHPFSSIHFYILLCSTCGVEIGVCAKVTGLRHIPMEDALLFDAQHVPVLCRLRACSGSTEVNGNLVVGLVGVQ